MPGFFDKVAKGLTETMDGVSKAITDATKPADTAGAAPAAPVGPSPSFNPGYVFSGPSEWITPEELGQVAPAAGVPATFGSPSSYETAETWMARWTSTDGAVTVDVTTYRDAMFERLGSFEAMIDELTPTFSEVSWAGEHPEFDAGVFGSRRDGHCGFLGAVGDTVLTAEVYGPAGPELEVAAYQIALRCVEE